MAWGGCPSQSRKAVVSYVVSFVDPAKKKKEGRLYINLFVGTGEIAQR